MRSIECVYTVLTKLASCNGKLDKGIEKYAWMPHNAAALRCIEELIGIFLFYFLERESLTYEVVGN